jgi:hypothetical protein
MVKLINLLEHKKNTRILVNGTVYTIGPDGIVELGKDEDAKKLLQNDRVWRKYHPKQAAALRAQAKAAAKGRMQLIGADGPIPKDDKPGDPMDPNLATYKRPNPNPKDKAPEGPPPVPDGVQTKEEPDPEDGVSGENPEGSEAESDWPDPDESMDVEYLREMAAAYEVKFNSRTSKKTLVTRISEAMYE